MTVSIELKQRRHTNYQELLIFLYLLSDFVEKINLNLNAKCVKQIGVLLSAAKRHDQIRQTIQHARCGTLNDSHSILWKSAERPKTLSTAFNCCLKQI